MRDDPLLGLLECRKTAAAAIALRRESIAQHAIKAFPCSQHLRALDRGRDVPRRIEDLARCDGDAEIAGIQTERFQMRDQLALGHDSRAAARELVLDPLEDFD